MKPFRIALLTVAFTAVAAFPAWGQRPLPRITQAVNNSLRVALKGSVHPLARPADNRGPVSASMRIDGITLYFRMSAAQQTALEALLREQRDPSSPNYHQWLTPDEFAARFGMSQEDLARVTTWLEGQGFAVDGVGRSHNSITFSGTAAQVNAAFHTQIDHFVVHGKAHFANATPLTIPAAFAGVVLAIRHLNDFRPHPRQGLIHRIRAPAAHFTSSISGNTYLAPADFATIYNVKGLYNMGDDGSGQMLAVVGQTAVNLSDIDAFRAAAALPQNDPEMILVPGTGASTDFQNDLGEADLDLEWSGGIAKNATILFVYVGNSNNYSVFDALQYAISNDLAPVISVSYGDCESDIGSGTENTIRQWAQQANSQGQTIIAASGDMGAADCEGNGSNPNAIITSASKGLAVDVPAAIPEVTGVGGTSFNGDLNNTSTYWAATNGPGGSSALQYIPETSWNDTNSTNGIAASGGGASSVYAKPSWQSAPGVPSDGQRDVPDIAFNASPGHDGYLVCTGGSCTNGFRDSGSYLTVYGGTSAGTPSFAGMLTLIEQALQANGVGNVNALMYKVASTPSSYASAFHDITSGDNKVPCTSGTPDCPSGTTSIGYNAGPGYDQVTGLGSIDALNLEQALAPLVPQGYAAKVGTATAVTVSTTSPAAGATVTFTATITPATSGGAAPTGTVQFTDNGVPLGSPVKLSSNTATTSTTYSAPGSHTIQAIYSGDSAYQGSSGVGPTVTVPGTVGTFSLNSSPSSLTISTLGNTGSSAITASSANGMSGAINFSCSVNTAAGTSNTSKTVLPTCLIPGTVTLSGGTTSGNATLTIGTVANSSIPVVPGGWGNATWTWLAAGIVLLGGMLLFGGLPQRRRATAIMAVALTGLVLTFAACGGGGSSSTPPTPTPPTGTGGTTTGTYSVTVIGTGPNNTTAQTTVTVTVN